MSFVKPTAKTWRLLPQDRPAADRLAAEVGISPVSAQILLNRGVRDASSARRFLEAPLTDLFTPDKLPGAAEAADRLGQCVQNRERVVVYGDYDVDGVCATAILYRLLRILGVPAEFYVPHRIEEGYGLKVEPLRQFAADGVQTVVTVDCGINSHVEAAEAQRLGLNLIITDHHEIGARLPQASAVVHPRLPEGDAPFVELSGAGVAFKVAWALAQKVSGGERVAGHLREFLLDAVALAAIGLIGDVMPLREENRVLVKHGLNRLRTAPLPGLRALVEASGISLEKPLRAEDVAFKLAPRLNAAGRLGCARLVVDLLTTFSEQRARELASYLDQQNRERQTLERRITSHARELLADSRELDRPALVLAHEDWHPGVIGIVAGRLADRYGKPTLIVAKGMNPATGSGRSVPGFDLHAALAACSSELLSFGGHAAAAGFRILPERIDSLRQKFCDVVAASWSPHASRDVLTLDLEVPLHVLTPGLLRELDRLEPYGAANPRPRFLAGDVSIVSVPQRIGGGERHLTFRVRQHTTTFRAVAFDMADRLDELMSEGGQCCLAFAPKMNTWQGMQNVELEVVDFQPGPRAVLG
ncbi:MAG: single-stranded-DNA-specific exonuclease RecJ [Gemmataceae bacterium]|nr:single-stranded-DNA-specific exonuclease RecJ [Gemmataceae bacterium]